MRWPWLWSDRGEKLTPQENNKYLGIAHLAYATLSCLFTLGFLAMFGAMFLAVANSPAQRNPPPTGLLLVIWLFFGAMYAAFTLPSFIAGYGILKRRRWAKIASIIASVIAAMFFPIGTAVCVYTLWFMFSEPGRLLYDTPVQSLPPTRLISISQDSINQHNQPQGSYATPPDWR